MTRDELIEYTQERFTYDFNTGNLFDKEENKPIENLNSIPQHLTIKGIQLNRSIISWILFYNEVPFFTIDYLDNPYSYEINNLAEGKRDRKNWLYHKLRTIPMKKTDNPAKRIRKHLIDKPTPKQFIDECNRVYRYVPETGELFRFNKPISHKSELFIILGIHTGRTLLSWILHTQTIPKYMIRHQGRTYYYSLQNLAPINKLCPFKNKLKFD